MKNLPTFEKFLTERKELKLNTWEESPGVINRFRLGSEVIGLRSVLNLSREKWTRSCSAFSPNEIGFENATDRKEAAEWIEKAFKSGKLKIEKYALNESNRTKRDDGKIYFHELSDIDHTRLIKWMVKNLEARVEDYDFVKGGKIEKDAYTLETSKMSERDLKDLLNYIDSQGYQFSTTIWLPAYLEEGLNEDSRKTDPSLKEHIGKKVAAILEDEDGENSYIKVKFTDNTHLSITAYPMGSGGVGLVAERKLNEDYIEYSVNDFPIGAHVHMADEVWMVVKPGSRNEKIFMAPFNREAKARYIQIAIEFDLNWLNANITKIDK